MNSFDKAMADDDETSVHERAQLLQRKLRSWINMELDDLNYNKTNLNGRYTCNKHYNPYSEELGLK